jgi:hypothetical protein
MITKKMGLALFTALMTIPLSGNAFAAPQTSWEVNLYTGQVADPSHLVYSEPLLIQLISTGNQSPLIPLYTPSSGYFTLYSGDPSTTQTGVMQIVANDSSNPTNLSLYVAEVGAGLDNNTNQISKQFNFAAEQSQKFSFTQSSGQVFYTIVITLEQSSQ